MHLRICHTHTHTIICFLCKKNLLIGDLFLQCIVLNDDAEEKENMDKVSDGQEVCEQYRATFDKAKISILEEKTHLLFITKCLLLDS